MCDIKKKQTSKVIAWYIDIRYIIIMKTTENIAWDHIIRVGNSFKNYLGLTPLYVFFSFYCIYFIENQHFSKYTHWLILKGFGLINSEFLAFCHNINIMFFQLTRYWDLIYYQSKLRFQYCTWYIEALKKISIFLFEIPNYTNEISKNYFNACEQIAILL